MVPAEGLRLAFELAAAGQPDREVAKALNAAGYRTSGNRHPNPLSKDTVRRVLTNRFYLGELPDGQGGWLPGKHEPLVDPALFARAQRAREANTRRPLRLAADASPWALSGVATCSCGASMRAYGRSGGKRRVQCVGRTERGDCDEPTFFAHVVEDQIGRLLARLAVPGADQRLLLSAWRHAQSRSTDVVAARLRLTRKLERLKRLYVEGDLGEAEYRAEKAAAAAELAALPEDNGNPDEAVGRRLLGYLADLAGAWSDATPAERNRISRQLFVEVIVENRTAVAIVPRPDVRPFLETLACQVPDEVTRWRKRRGSDPHVQNLAGRRVPVPDPFGGLAFPPCRTSGSPPGGPSRRFRTRACKLTLEQDASIRALALTRSLRSLAAEFGVSHETIRAVLGKKDGSAAG